MTFAHSVTQPRNNQCRVSIPDSVWILPSALWDKEEEQGRNREDGEWEKHSHLCVLPRGKIGFPHLEIQKLCIPRSVLAVGRLVHSN